MTLEIANRLIQLRKEHGFSQETLAEKLGVSRQAVSKWERAEACPDIENLIQLADLYDIALDALLRGLQRMPSEIISLSPEPAPTASETPPEPTVSAHSSSDVNRQPEPSSPPPPQPEACAPVYAQPQPVRKRSPLRIFLLAFPYPVLVALVFFVLGIVWQKWNVGWILFLTIPLYYSVVHALFPTEYTHPKNRPARTRLHQFFITFPYPILAVIVFFATVFLFDSWKMAWLVFLTIPIYYILVNAIFHGIEMSRFDQKNGNMK